MNNINKLFAVLFLFLMLSAGFVIGKNQLASYLLTQELSSELKVKEILAESDNPSTDYYQNIVFNNADLGLAPDNSEYLSQITDTEGILGEKVLGVGDERWIEVNLSQQRLYGWEGGNQVYNFLISSGRWAPTPTGEYRVWTKLKSTTMKGGSKALGTYYYLPNVPCTMYFYKGYGIHGAYWHNNFGHPMSHGCVNMRPNESCELFNWASVGTRVVIHK
jgi:lipoprotein-anchoring transpeptidase ErfK/SrfK